VTVNADPEFQSTNIYDGGDSSISCTTFGYWGACGGSWTQELDAHADFTLDDPSATGDKVEGYFQTDDGDKSDTTITDYGIWGADDDGTLEYFDSHSDALGGCKENHDVTVDFDVYRNGAITDQTSDSTTIDIGSCG
jgi:hypothetical protein